MDMASNLPPLDWHALSTTWQFQPGWTLAAIALLAAYLLGLARCRSAGVRPVAPWRVASYVGGVVVLVATVSSAFDVYAMAAFWVHMIEHLLLIMVVPALLVIGHPLSVVRGVAVTRGTEDRFDRVVRSGPVAVLTHPLVGLGFYSAVIVGTHLTSFMDAMVEHPWLMPAEQVLYVVSGYLFLLTIVGNEPIRWQVPHLGRLMLVLVGMTPDTVVGIVLMQTESNPFPVMTAGRPGWARAPLDDLELAGGIMWAGGDGLMMLMGIGIVAAMMLPGGRVNVLGGWLEGVRSQTMAAHVAQVDASGDDALDGPDRERSFAAGADVDDDDEVLDAYNRMLGRLGGQR